MRLLKLLKLFVGCLGFVLMAAIAFLAFNEVQLSNYPKLNDYALDFLIATILFVGSFVIPEK
jgi:hypothetical protein